MTADEHLNLFKTEAPAEAFTLKRKSSWLETRNSNSCSVWVILMFYPKNRKTKNVINNSKKMWEMLSSWDDLIQV